MSREDTTELRMDAPTDMVNVLDGVSLAQRITRNQLVLRLLSEWADARVHEHMMLSRLGVINPARAESAGVAAEAAGKARG